jgi:hypothetical protein
MQSCIIFTWLRLWMKFSCSLGYSPTKYTVKMKVWGNFFKGRNSCKCETYESDTVYEILLTKFTTSWTLHYGSGSTENAAASSGTGSILKTRGQISGRQTPGLTWGSSPFYITNAGGKPRVKPGVWRPEMWSQATGEQQWCYLMAVRMLSPVTMTVRISASCSSY